MKAIQPRLRFAPLLAPLLLLALAAGPAAATTSGLLHSGPGPSIGCLPPHFTLPTPDGKEIDIGDFKGRVVLLVFCSGYTDSCCKLVKSLNALLDVYEERGMVAPLVISEMPPPNKSKCADIAERIPRRFPTMIDADRQLKLSFKVVQLPTTFVIGRDFCIREKVRGEAVFYDQEFRGRLEAMLAEQP
jgi:peroxiredoxin